MQVFASRKGWFLMLVLLFMHETSVAASCGSAAAIDTSCCTKVRGCMMPQGGSCPDGSPYVSTMSLNSAGTMYDGKFGGWGVYLDSSSNEWKFEQCEPASGLVGATNASAVCPTTLPQGVWTFSGNWGASLPPSGSYYVFTCFPYISANERNYALLCVALFYMVFCLNLIRVRSRDRNTPNKTVTAQAEAIQQLVSEPKVYLVTGPSGCGKTTFVETLRPSIYLTQYHSLRPGGKVTTFFSLSQLKLPFSVEANKRFGGEIMPGAIVKGLSGGQRKLCLTSHLNQVILKSKRPLMVVLDEPFAGVTTHYIQYQLDLIHTWIKNGHNVIVIDNDHHEQTTRQGWTRIQLDMRKVTQYGDKPVDLPVPLLPVDRRPVAANYVQDLKLFMKHDCLNRGTLTNTKFIQGLVASIVIMPFIAGPETDSGAVLMGMSMIMMIIMSSGQFLPGREAQYSQIHGEAAIGLVTAPSFSLILTQIDDFLKMMSLAAILFSLHSIWWDEDVVSTWPNGGSIWGMMAAAQMFLFHNMSITTALIFSGVPLVFVVPVIMTDNICTFFIAGMFNPEAGVLPGNRYGFIGQLPSAFVTFTGSAFAPFVDVFFQRSDAAASFMMWTIIDIVMFCTPLWLPWSSHVVKKWRSATPATLQAGASSVEA